MWTLIDSGLRNGSGNTRRSGMTWSRSRRAVASGETTPAAAARRLLNALDTTTP